MSDRRYPVEPLCALMRLAPSTALGRLGVSGSTMQKYRDEGVSAGVADRLAVRAGYHPAEVWPEWVDEQMEATKVECAAEDCAERFLPSNAKHRYCSHRCQSRIAARRRYANDREARERKIAQQRRYDSETVEYRRMQRRRRYWADPEREREQVRARYWTDPERERERKRKDRDERTGDKIRSTYANYKDAPDQGFSTVSTPRTPGPLQGTYRTMGHMNDDIEGAA